MMASFSPTALANDGSTIKGCSFIRSLLMKKPLSFRKEAPQDTILAPIIGNNSVDTTELLVVL